MPFTNKKLLLLLFTALQLFGHIKLLDSSSFKQRSFYSKQSTSNHTKQTTSISNNNTPKQKKGLKKSVLKDKARCYDYESARNAENGTNVEKIQ